MDNTASDKYNLHPMDFIPVCKKCNKKLSSTQGLEKHLKRKIPCDKVIHCPKCDKIFKTTQLLLTHQNRKTPCEPIVGNPTEPTPKNACMFCGRQLSSKQSLKNHFNTCKIKNGGMALLFEKVKQLEDDNKKLNAKVLTLEGKNPQIENQTNNIGNTHHNTQININFVNWDDNDILIKKILAEHLPRILAEPKQEDVSYIKQVSDRMVNLVGIVFRNPDYKELQGIYVVDLSKNTDNAFTYNDDKWVITNWEDLRNNMLQKIYNCKPRGNDEDALDIIKYLFVLGKCGDCKSIRRLSNEETLRIYGEISKDLHFNTMSLK